MQVQVCDGFIERGRGLLWRARLSPQAALLLPNCSSIHTLGMRYDLDVLFCDAEGRIVKLIHNLSPWRTARCAAAHQVWELRAGQAALLGWRLGDCLKISDVEIGPAES